jgi:hypothetical protein
MLCARPRVTILLATLLAGACDNTPIAPPTMDAALASDAAVPDAPAGADTAGADATTPADSASAPDVAAADAACAASGASCAISRCCASPGDSCFPQGSGDSVCAHAEPPPHQGGACNGAASSTIPGVKIEFTDDVCGYSLAQLAAGIKVGYRLVIAGDVPGLHPGPLDFGGCDRPSAAHGLIVGFSITGSAQRYCVCDVGDCGGGMSFTTTAKQGTYADAVSWAGRNWDGPSDTNNRPGEPFPPGTYTLHVRAEGTRDKPGGGSEPFEVSAIRFLTIDPGP